MEIATKESLAAVKLRIRSYNCGGLSNVTMTMWKDLGLERSLKSYYKRSDERAGQKMELAGTRPTHARAPVGALSLVKRRQTYSRDVSPRRTKPKYRKLC